MLYRYRLFLALLLLPLLIASSDRSPVCLVEYTDLKNTTFNGTANVLTESYSDGIKVVIKVEKILFDPTKALRLRSNLIEGYLSSPICVSSVLIGKQQMWTGSHKFDGIKHKFVVQVVRHSDTLKEDPCLQKQCHPGAICETWNDATPSRVAVCVCLPLHDLETSGRCQLTTGEVCASDGNIYANTCHMLRNSCLQQTGLRIVSWTAVNRKDCQQQAESDKLRHFRSQLNEHYKLIAYTPHLTYDDEIQGEKPQQDGVNPTRGILVASTREKDCVHTCSLTEVQPVCGSDGNTYLNPCLLKLRSCMSKHPDELKIAHWGYCPARPPDIEPIFCDYANYCQFGAMCTKSSQILPPYSYETFSSMLRQTEEQSLLCTCGHYRCSEKWYKEPICGDDGVTYPGDCFLNQAACIQQSPKHKLHSGSCKTPNQGVNPCLEQGCTWPGEECRVDIQGKKKCVCLERCPAIVVPVCGSDGITYDSVCHLLRTACLKKKHIWVVYAGQCVLPGNACERQGLYCQRYEICTQGSNQLNRDMSLTYVAPSPKCSCPVCPESGFGGKVCGSDGRTYRSECHLRAAACQGGHFDLEIRQRGACDACQNKKCKFYSMCQTDEAGRAFCACPTNCLMINMPVCGSDGRTYSNECLLKVHACSIQKDITVIDTKPCATCAKPCPLGMRCLGGQCVCRESCPKSSLTGEVCGTDGRIYPSACELRRQACINKVTVKVDGSGLACRKPTFTTNTSTSIDIQADQVIENACGCNKVGSRDQFCDSKGRCRCHWGVEGTKCDQCALGYWGISNGKPCISCSCNPFGSITVRTCDSYSGQCKCKPGIRGQQCNICPDGELLTGEHCKEPLSKMPDTKSDVHKAGEGALVSGINFTPLATAFIPFIQPISPPFTFTLKFTPSSSVSDGDIALLVIPRVNQVGQYSFLKLAISSRNLELSYVSKLGTGKMQYIMGKHRLEPYPIKVSAEVTHDEDLSLYMANSTDFSVVEGASSRFIRSDEYGAMISNRGMGLVLGCASPNEELGGKCGFSGCLTEVELVYFPTNGQVQKHIFVTNGKASELNWKHPPRDGTQAFASQESPKNPPSFESSFNCDSRNPCKNGGQCILKADGNFKQCICLPGWQGIHCQSEATIIPEFNGKAFIRLAGPTGAESLKKRKMGLELIFLRKSDEGIIFAIPPSQTGSEFIVIRADADECIKVYLRVGRIAQFSHSYFYSWLVERFGPRKRLAIAKICSVTNDEWHKLSIEKTSLHMTVRLDDKASTDLRLLPQGLPKTNRELRRTLTTFDLSSSPVYLGGIPDIESHFLEDFVPSKQSFVGAIQKVVLNGAELVLAGPAQNKEDPPREPRLEHWEGTTQWQGPPCGENYSMCAKDSRSMKRICWPLGSGYKCSCSTPITHMSFLRHLTASLGEIDVLNNMTAQQEISAKAEEMACDAIAARIRMASKELQHDVPSKGNKIAISFSQDRQKEVNHVGGNAGRLGDSAILSRNSVLLGGGTVISYRGFVEKENILDNIRIQLKTETPDGLILMIPDRSHQIEELIAISLSGGRPEAYLSLKSSDYSFLLKRDGSHLDRRKVTTLKAAPFVADGNWHTVHLIRSKGRLSLIVDDQMVSGELTGTDGILNNEGCIWLGGSLEQVTTLPWQYQRNFTGCISALFLNEVSIALLGDADILYGTISSCS